ncbi:hypothetical protein V6N13_094458 [Hibiscus sabdariffa]
MVMGRDTVHDQRIPLLQPGIDLQGGGHRGYRERSSNQLDEHELELAVERRPRGSVAVVQGDRHTSASWNMAPAHWQFGQTFTGKNFRV